jgi:hypothetical protein
MDRKQFLGTLFVLPIGIFLVHCSSSGSASGDSNAPAAPPTQSNGMDVYSSSTVQQHFHTFSLDDASVTSPPAAGVMGDTSVDSDHSHTVTISADQLTQVSMGQSVDITTGVAGAHTHVFTFTKIM